MASPVSQGKGAASGSPFPPRFPPSPRRLLGKGEGLVHQSLAWHRFADEADGVSRLAVDELGRSLLSERGLEVVCARSGTEAIRKFEERAFDLVIMDIKMPRLSGFDTTKKIREIEQRRKTRTPIIAMTAHVTANGVEAYEEAGMDDMLAKPFSIDKLDNILDRWLT